LREPEPYIVLELCDGPKLRDWVGRVAWQTAATIILQAAIGLSALHRAGGFHRDIKPENLLLTNSAARNGWLLKVADFGLARRPVTQGSGMTRTLGGTEGYIAPDDVFTPASDVFSLGIVGLELLSGRRAPKGLSTLDLPQAVRNLLGRMIAPTPTARPTCDDIIRALTAVLPAGAGQLISLEIPDAASPAAPQVPWAVIGTWTAALALVALAADRPKWDPSVQRYRGSNGQFR
jgi:serine/threonine protein kinase